jgi:hypothetical protein
MEETKRTFLHPNDRSFQRQQRLTVMGSGAIVFFSRERFDAYHRLNLAICCNFEQEFGLFLLWPF